MNRESRWPVQTITCSLTRNESQTDSYTESVELTEVFTRVSILDVGVSALCVGNTPPVVDTFLATIPDFFRCGCCPCFAWVKCKTQTDLSLLPIVGTRTYLGVDPLPPESIYGHVSSISFVPAACRPGMPEPFTWILLDGYGHEAVPPYTAGIAISTVIPASATPPATEEQRVSISGSTFYAGTAQLQWTNPDGWTVDIAIDCGPPPPGMTVPPVDFSGTATFTLPPGATAPTIDPAEGILVLPLADGPGVLIIYGGQYTGAAEIAQATVVTNDITCWEYLPSVVPGVITATATMQILLYTKVGDNFVSHGGVEVSWEVPGACPQDYSHTEAIEAPPDPPEGFSLSGTVSCIWT